MRRRSVLTGAAAGLAAMAAAITTYAMREDDPEHPPGELFSGPLPGFADRPVAAAVGPNGATVAVTYGSGSLRLWDAAAGELRSTRPGISGGQLVFTPDGSLVIGVGEDSVWCVDSTTGALRWRQSGRFVTEAALRPDGRVFAIGTDHQSIEIRNSADGEQRAVLPNGQLDVRDLVYGPDGRRIATSDERSLRIWEPDGLLREERLVELGKEWPMFVAGFTPDGSGLYVHYGAILHRWDIGSADRGRRLLRDPSAIEVLLSADRRVALTLGSHDHRVANLWEVPAGRKIRKFTGHLGAVRTGGLSADGTVVATVGNDDTVRVWRAR